MTCIRVLAVPLLLLGVALPASAGRRCCCPAPAASFNPCNSSYGRLLSYTEALSRAEDANRVEATLKSAQAELAKVKAQLAATEAARDKALAEAKKATELAATLKTRVDNAVKQRQAAENAPRPRKLGPSVPVLA